MTSPPTCDLRIDGRLLLGAGRPEPGSVLVHDGLVTWVGPRDQAPETTPDRTLSAGPGYVLPGLLDLHVHGGGGADAADGTEAALTTLRLVHGRHGTTGLCPTVLSAPPEVLPRALEAIRRATGTPAAGARLLGAHLEGPFLSPARTRAARAP